MALLQSAHSFSGGLGSSPGRDRSVLGPLVLMEMTLVKSIHTIIIPYFDAKYEAGYLVLWMGQVANGGHGEDGPVVGHEVEHPYVWAPLTGPRTHSSTTHWDVRGKNPKECTKRDKTCELCERPCFFFASHREVKNITDGRDGREISWNWVIICPSKQCTAILYIFFNIRIASVARFLLSVLLLFAIFPRRKAGCGRQKDYSIPRVPECLSHRQS